MTCSTNNKETSLKIARLDKDTMEVLEIYESGLQAVKWLVEHGYTNSKYILGIVGSIQDCCRGKYETSYKFVWRFMTEDEKVIPPEDAPQAQFSGKSIPIQALDVNTGEVVRTFKSKSEAMRWLKGEGKTVKTNPSALNKAIKHNKPAYGYLWKEL